MPADCLFCRIIRGEIPATRLHEDELVIAIRDINPQAPTHVLVLPVRHVASAAELGDDWAQLKVGSNLFYGSPPHIAADPARGIAWLERSAAQGNADARKMLDRIRAGR